MKKSNVLVRGKKKRAARLVELNRLAEARVLYEQICRVDRGDAESWARLARLNWRLGRLKEAETCCHKAIGLRPDQIDAHSVLGMLCLASQRLKGAESAFRRVLDLDHNRAEAYNNLGQVLGLSKRPDEAAQYLRKGLLLQPDAPQLHNNLGHVLRSMGLVEESAAAHRKAVELEPASPAFYSNWLLSLNYLPAAKPEWIAEQHAEWGRRFTASIPQCTEYPNSRDPQRSLRVGYVSPDFQQHPVACFIEPVLASHNRADIQLFCYADVAKADTVTERLRGLGGTWRMTYGLADSEFIAQVRNDGIDILVDLAGHTANNRLLSFAARPVPVQVSYLGYCNTTGLSQIDYRISDAVADPPGSEKLYTEKLVWLDSGFSRYAPPQKAPDILEPPVERFGRITFGSLNMLGKLNTDMISLWSKVLQAVPGSRLLIVREELRGTVRDRFRRLFADRGAGDAIELRSDLGPDRSHLSIYNEIDIALDTFPWNGHTTACEALWMGVPVVALAGNKHSGRMCASVLSQLGLQDLVARDAQEYVDIAAALAAERTRLVELRRGLRFQMASSAATGGALIARELEHAYRKMWRQWCGQTA